MLFRLGLAALSLGVALALAQAAHAHGPTVEITAQGVEPVELRIERGATVHFHNADGRPHVVVGADDAFRSPELAAEGGGWHLRFPFPGRFPFALEARPEAEGAIVVEEAGG